jgi:hypothetical protein
MPIRHKDKQLEISSPKRITGKLSPWYFGRENSLEAVTISSRHQQQANCDLILFKYSFIKS